MTVVPPRSGIDACHLRLDSGASPAAQFYFRSGITCDDFACHDFLSIPNSPSVDLGVHICYPTINRQRALKLVNECFFYESNHIFH
jgi:hypothetical protein